MTSRTSECVNPDSFPPRSALVYSLRPTSSVGAYEILVEKSGLLFFVWITRRFPLERTYRVENVDVVDSTIWEAVGGGVQRYNVAQAGDDRGQRLCFVLRDADEAVVGGVIGETHWGWFCLDLLWVKEALRGQGYGHRLLTLAEDEARRRGAKMAYLDTFSFQAPSFYTAHGYRVFGELGEFPAGHRRYYMKKTL